MDQKLNNQGVIAVSKPLGLTPLQTLDAIRDNYPQYAESKLSYAGRLDPMAEGVMLVLVGDANQRRQQYLGLDKEYEVEVLVGLGTDTGDVLGVIANQAIFPIDIKQVKSQIPEIANNLKGKFVQEYPKYSSPVIAGKDRFAKEVEVYDVSIDSINLVSVGHLKETVSCKLKQLVRYNPGEDFRQSDILSRWLSWFDGVDGEGNLVIVKVRVRCSSGVYMRVLAERLGFMLGQPALALSIVRTKVGEIGLDQCLKLQ